MLTLTLFRHAKSSWELNGLDDRERPLNARGAAAAPLMGAFMQEHRIRPEFVLCSTAIRTRQTLDLAIMELKPAPKVKHEAALYLADPLLLLERVRKTPRTVKHLMIVGHNPGLQILAIELIGDGDPELIRSLSDKLPTAGVAVITFEAKTWTDVGPGKGQPPPLRNTEAADGRGCVIGRRPRPAALTILCRSSPVARARRTDVRDMAMVGAAAAAEHAYLRERTQQVAILPAKRNGIARVEIWCRIEFRVAALRRVSADAANPLGPIRAALERTFEVGRMCAVDHVVRGAVARRRIDRRDGFLEAVAARQPAVGLHRE